MPPIPPASLLNKELVNVPVALLYSRRKLFEKIVANIAKRKIQNSIQATGDRMSVTPQQFGMQVGKQFGKQAFLGPGLVGAGIGAATSPEGHRMEGASRGALKATGTSLGAVAGVPAGILAALMLLKGKKIPRLPGRGPIRYPQSRRAAENLARLTAAVGVGGPAGAALGGGAGYAGTSALLGKPSWEGKQASVLSVLGGLAGGGLGGLAGGGAGGILGALGGGALGGGPGAGLGLLAGGAAGLGAGAHMGGNIGADIGRSFSKKKEKPESAEKEEKSEEKSEDSGDEEVKKSAAAVLAQLQKNAQ